MAIEYRCPVCHVVLHVSAGHTGSVRCHECVSVFPMPDGRVVLDPGSKPKREAEPPPPRSRALFYIVATLAVQLVLAAIGLLVWVLLPDRARWQTHESTAGGYRIEFPAPPRYIDGGMVGVVPYDQAQAEGVGFNEVGYFVHWGDIPGRAGRTDEELIEEAINGVERLVPIFERGRSVTVNGFRGQDFKRFEGEGRGGQVYRVVVADTRVYVLGVGGPGLDSKGLEAMRFLNSFEITDPAILQRANR